jgi:hypothetical protein
MVADPRRRLRSERERPGERLAAVREAALDQRPQRGLRRGAPAGQAHQHGVDVRHRVEDGTGHGPQDLDVAGELGEHARHAVRGAAGRGRESLPHLPLHHRDPGGDAREVGDRAQDDGRGDAVGQVRDDLRGGRVERREVELDGVGEVERRVRMRVERVAQRGLEAAVQLDDVDVRHALGQVLGQDAEAAADLEHHVGRVELGGAGDDVEDVRVDQEVLAEVALRADAERLHPPQARLRGELAHQPSSRALLACTAASSSS